MSDAEKDKLEHDAGAAADKAHADREAVEAAKLSAENAQKDRLEQEAKAEKGIYMIRAQLEDLLRKRGLERMVIAIGSQFDPNLHESVGEVEAAQPPGAIAMEIERGYLLNGRVLRPARVKLSKSKNNN